MSMIGKLNVILLSAIAVVVGSEGAYIASGTDAFSLISTAEARVGRPMTPVSVAGVARRTTRRCAAGVYRC
jgi:hypothetical protein